MNELKINQISKTAFLNLNEKDVMFITIPGRMGDEDGATFIIKQDNKFIIYRMNGWMYGTEDKNPISINDVKNQFPKWYETWQNCKKENYQGKYKYIYMGYGNGLCIDNSIYEEYKPYLDESIKSYLEKYPEEERQKLKNAAVFNEWKNAIVIMTNDKGYELK